MLVTLAPAVCAIAIPNAVDLYLTVTRNKENVLHTNIVKPKVTVLPQLSTAIVHIFVQLIIIVPLT